MARQGAHPRREILARTVDAGCPQNAGCSRYCYIQFAHRRRAHAGASGSLGLDRGGPGSHCSSQREPLSQVSPTTADHVRQGLGNRVDYILDGGSCQVGIESTVLSIVTEVPVLLRPGAISRQQIEEVIGAIARSEQNPTGAHPSPGMHRRHYSPRTPLHLVHQGCVPTMGAGAYLQVRYPP